jgi:hypothetical protein
VILAFVIASLPSFAFAETTPVAAGGNEKSLLDLSDLQGGAVPTPDEFVARHRRINTAMLAALQSEAQLRRVELFLKSGAAQDGDLRVVQAGHPDPEQK